MICPKCKKNELEIRPHPAKEGREIGVCNCNPAGPVLERNAAKAASKKKDAKSGE